MERNRVRLLAAAAVAALAGVALAVAAPGSSGSTTPSAAGATAATPKKLPMKTIGIMGPVDAAEIIKLGTDASNLAAKTLGWKTIRVDPNGDPAKMASGMNSLVNSNVDAIVLTIIEPATIQAGLRAAARKKIPVINTMAATHQSPLQAGTYWPSPQAENNLLIRKMKQSLPRGSKVGVIQLPQFFNALIAQNLFVKSAKQQGWQIVARHDTDLTNLVPDVKKAVGDMIRANPDLDAVFGCCDFAVAGSVPAIRASGKPIKFFSLHGVPSSVQFVKSGDAQVEVADYQRGSFMAMDALAAHFASGKPIPKRNPTPFHMTLIDKSTTTYPYPTRKLLAEYKARWSTLYIRAG